MNKKAVKKALAKKKPKKANLKHTLDSDVLADIAKNVTKLTHAVASLPTSSTTFVSTLGVNDLELVKPIPVTVEMDEDGSHIASFLDAGVSSGGETLQSAIWSLQAMIASSYRMLRDMPDVQLGPKMRREKQILMEFVCPSLPRPTPKTPPRS